MQILNGLSRSMLLSPNMKSKQGLGGSFVVVLPSPSYAWVSHPISQPFNDQASSLFHMFIRTLATWISRNATVWHSERASASYFFSCHWQKIWIVCNWSGRWRRCCGLSLRWRLGGMLRNVTFGSATSRTRSMFVSLIMSVSKVKSDLPTTRNPRRGGVRKAISISVFEYTCQHFISLST